MLQGEIIVIQLRFIYTQTTVLARPTIMEMLLSVIIQQKLRSQVTAAD